MYEELKQRHKDVVIRCIEIMGLKNPDKLTTVTAHSFTHTNARGRKRLFTVYSSSEYWAEWKRKSGDIRNKKLHRVMTYYITEEDVNESPSSGPPKTEGEKIDSGFKGEGFCDEMCNHCMSETYNIPTDRVSLCAHCGKELFPCSVCDESCDWSRVTYACHRFSHSAEFIAEENEGSTNGKQ